MKTAALLSALLLVGWALAQESGPLAGLAKPIQGKSKRETSTFRMGKDGKYDRTAPTTTDLLEHSNRDNFRVNPGETHVLMDAKGPGVITHIWMTFLGPERQDWAKQGSANHQEMLLRIYWDGSKKPAVEAPVGDFFASCFGRRDQVISLPVVLEDGDSYNCFWHMPFRKSARIEIINQSEKPISLLYYNIDWIKRDRIPNDTPYFHAQYRQEYPVENGKDYTILETTGKGHYVGTVLAVRTRSPSWFGEGDERIYIDGEKEPSIQGTGTEDYFLSAWGLKTTTTPYFGVPYFDQWGIVGGHTSAYRWHLNDPIVFEKGIKVTIEHWGWISPDENKENRAMSWNEREDDFSSVAFWYQTGESTFAARAPDAKARKLPSLERVTVAAKDFLDSHFHGLGAAEKQYLDIHDAEQLLYMPKSQEGAYVDIHFTVEKKEPLRLLLNCTASYDFGRYQAYLVPPGALQKVKLQGAFDLYSQDIKQVEVHLLDFWPEPGYYKLRLECVGKNPRSEGFYLGLESVRLRERRPRVAQMGWDKGKDWTKNPTLYN
ncbi:MAG: DUF2961 domain-containing protein [Armatimonadetes bacterium]|nr:DUF2961 domain-containing protein [Armatimonadota bacterium]